MKRTVHNAGRSADLPTQITRQFNSEVLEKGLRLAEASRISHINFGRESYFGLVTEGSEKPVNVHICLDPETKTLEKATCGCFRSGTRTYCHHIVSFIKYILRPDPNTGRLRSLSEDFQEDFWHDIGWQGYRNYGDSILGFKAAVNHSDDHIRITFRERDHECLAFMPGARLVEEFLYEFFELIRRDIDPVLYKRLYGRKLKDPNVPSLRRRPWQPTEAEEEINRRGLKSVRQQFEDSLWRRIAKVGFLLSGRGGGHFSFSFLEHKQELVVEALDENENVIMRFTPQRNHIGAVMDAADRRGIIHPHIFIHPEPLKTGYRIDLDESSAMVITPIVENPLKDDDEPEYFDRTEIDHHLYGPYYFFPDQGFFRISVHVSNLPAEYFSSQRKTVIEPGRITEFLHEYGDMLREEPGIILDARLLNRRTLNTYEKALFTHESVNEKGLDLSIAYDFGGFKMGCREIFHARSHNIRFLIHEDTWIDTKSSRFAWMDSLKDLDFSDSGALRMGRADYLRVNAMHERAETRFADAGVKSAVDQLRKLKAPGRLPSLRAMKGKLRQYQKNGVGWLYFLYENEFSGLLCDDMGLGKTHQIMALMTAVYQKNLHRIKDLKFLVVCPTTVLSHWKDKVLQFCPTLDPYIYHGTDRSFQEAFEEHSLIITSYGIALRDVDMLAEFKYELMVLDEVQAVKNKSTKTYQAVKNLDSVCTVGLTGTPVENSVADLKALFDIVLPGYLMSDSLFETQFRAPIEETGDKTVSEKLAAIIKPFTLRRRKEQVLKELPAKIEDVRRCSLSEDQIRFYRDIIQNRGNELALTLKDPERKVPYMHVFAVLNYLKQVCCHPVLLEGDKKNYGKYQSGKWDLFVELLDESLGSGQKVVVFSQYVKMLDLIESFLKDRGIGYTGIRGQTRNRAGAVKKFNTDPDCMVFCASLRASGLGIDLTGGSVVIHYDRWWNSAREEQATDRVHRIGQQRGVQVFKLVTEHTLEEKIDRIISEKRKLMESVVKEDDQLLLKRFTREELIELISF